MTERFDWTPASASPARSDVLALQGMAEGDPVSPRIEVLFDRAMAIYREIAEPRALVCDIGADDFAFVFRGEGRNEPDTPVAAIYPKADRLALVAATIGAAMSDRIKELFHRHELALGCMLDAVGSAAADRLGELAGERFLASAALGASTHVLAYSPGYCGWHVSGQRGLFAYLRPEQIGITLNASCLMQPLKSISGVLVAGPGSVHRFRPVYPFCEACREKPCCDRMARVTHAERAVLPRGAQGTTERGPAGPPTRSS